MNSLAGNAFHQITIMFLIILLGAVCYRVNLITKESNKKLSDLVLMLINPLVIFISYQRKFEATLLKGLFISLVLAAATHVIGIIISIIVVRGKKQKEDVPIERFAIIYSNCGFIGIPLVNGMFGSEGVFYITAYMTLFNLFVWTHGVIMMTGKKDRKTILQALTSPSVIATLSGFILFVVRINLPDLLVETMTYVANMNTPMAMLVAGVTIAQTDIKQLITKVRVYYITFFKLIVVPIAMLLLFSLFPLPRVVLLTSVLAAACPAAATINLFSIRFEKNYLYASELFAVTTLLSIVTIPIVLTIAGLFV